MRCSPNELEERTSNIWRSFVPAQTTFFSSRIYSSAWWLEQHRPNANGGVLDLRIDCEATAAGALENSLLDAYTEIRAHGSPKGGARMAVQTLVQECFENAGSVHQKCGLRRLWRELDATVKRGGTVEVMFGLRGDERETEIFGNLDCEQGAEAGVDGAESSGSGVQGAQLPGGGDGSLGDTNTVKVESEWIPSSAFSEGATAVVGPIHPVK